MKDIVKDGLQTTTYNLDEKEEKIIVKEEDRKKDIVRKRGIGEE